MKKIILTAVFICAISVPAFAREAYVAITSGIWMPDKTNYLNSSLNPADATYDSGWLIGGAYGVSTGNNLRIETELSYRQAPAKGNSNDSWALGMLVNLWYDFKNSSIFTPYAGGGLGFGHSHVSSPGPVDHTGSGLAYQAGGGVDIRIAKKLSLDVGYRYFGVADTSNSSNTSTDIDGSTIIGGVRMRF